MGGGGCIFPAPPHQLYQTTKKEIPEQTTTAVRPDNKGKKMKVYSAQNRAPVRRDNLRGATKRTLPSLCYNLIILRECKKFRTVLQKSVKK